MSRDSKTLNPERRDKIIDAGQALFLRDGLRGATMEAIARQAGVAKATLYGYFPDKEAVFAAVVGRFADSLRRAAEQDFGRDDAAWMRIATALGNKHKAVFRLLEGSPHASELYEAGSPANSPELKELDQWVEKEIARLLQEAGHPEPVRYANLFAACADGIAHRADYAEQIGPAVRLVAEKLLKA